MYEFLENVGPFDDKLMKGFTIQLGRKGTDMEQMSMREHPISELTG
jgi:hypothetical protein